MPAKRRRRSVTRFHRPNPILMLMNHLDVRIIQATTGELICATGSWRWPTRHIALFGQATHGAKPRQVHREYQDPEDH
jgi:hypothetical protein